MYDRLQLRSTPRSIIADFLDFLLMCVLKDPVSLMKAVFKAANKEGYVPITSQMKLLLLLILLNTPQNLLILHSNSLQQRRQIIHRKMPIGTSVALPRPRWMLRQNLLTTKRRIPISSPIRIPTNITIRMAHIIPILLIKRIIRDLIESLSPKQQTLFQIQPNAFQEQRVLETTVVFEV
jgi:hypothetical protein